MAGEEEHVEKGNVLVIGGGGREHAICWKLAESKHVQKVFICPGNAGTERELKCENVTTIDVTNHNAVVEFCKSNNVDLVVVGPEIPLADGISDSLYKANIACFGPSKAAAQIEASKQFAKTFMDKYQIPTARWKSFHCAEDAISYINSLNWDGYVVKASGLAAGKGVVVSNSKQEAIDAVTGMMKDRQFGEAGATVVVEEFLEGEEVSILAFTDGIHIKAFPPARDFKRLLDSNMGPNTGGMGAYCPASDVCPSEMLIDVCSNVLQKTVDALRNDGTPFVGILYAGLMITKSGPVVLEFNCRFGDPDLYTVMSACAQGNLKAAPVEFREGHASVTVVMASGGYPLSYQKGFTITGMEEAERADSRIKVLHAGTCVQEETVVTAGGRVLAVTAIGPSVAAARQKAYDGVACISFENATFRTDIASVASSVKCKPASLTYADSGVSIAAGAALVDAIKPLAKGTARAGCAPDLGSFGGLFDLAASGYNSDTILVSGADGVGTKLKVAQACKKHASVGIDLVAMCVNDILAQGAEPLLFLDYYACGKLDPTVAKEVISGIAEGCRQSGCALVGGETAEMPGMYANGEYDLAGFAVGAVTKGDLLPRCQDIAPGDAVIGLASSGLHSNGFSLVRHVVAAQGLDYEAPCPYETSNGQSLGDDLLTPTRIYVKTVLPLMRDGLVKAFAHVTGGGLVENIPRVLPSQCGVALDACRWLIPPVFAWLSRAGNVDPIEMISSFNCGVGAVLIVSQNDRETVLRRLNANGETSTCIGSVVDARDSSDSRVDVASLCDAFVERVPSLVQSNAVTTASQTMRVAVLISGSGTNLQALIDASTANAAGHAIIALVISNVDGVKGLERARKANIPSVVIDHKQFKNRLAFDMAVHDCLRSHGIEVICLAGFMRILTGEFVRQWCGKLINVHPSLLPSFKGLHVHEQVLEAGVRVSGCTVHFVVEDVDAGGIITQETVEVRHDDTVERLQERVKEAEHRAYPKALELLCSRRVTMSDEGKTKWKL